MPKAKGRTRKSRNRTRTSSRQVGYVETSTQPQAEQQIVQDNKGNGSGAYKLAGIAVILVLAALAAWLYYGRVSHNVSLSGSSAVSGSQQDWGSFILNANDTRYAPSSTVTSSNIDKLEEKWFIQTGYSVTSTPVVLNGTVYFADWGGNVYAANVTTGAIEWRANLNSNDTVLASISSTPVLFDGMVLIGYGPNCTQVAALSQSTGKILWDTALAGDMRGLWGSPDVFPNPTYKDMLFVGTAAGESQQAENNSSLSGMIYGLSALNGSEIWALNVSGSEGGAGVWGSPVYDSALDAIFLGVGNPYNPAVTNATIGYGYSLMSINATTGQVNWYFSAYNAFNSGGDYDFGSTPNLFDVQINGTTYRAVGLGNKNGIYYVLDAATGQPLREYTAMPEIGIIGLAGYEYASSGNPEIFIPAYTESDTMTNTSICCGLVAAYYPASNRTAWEYITKGNIFGSVAIVPGAVFVGDVDGNAYALSTANGSVLWHISEGAPIFGGISVAEGHVFVPTSFNPNASTLGLYAYAPS